MWKLRRIFKINNLIKLNDGNKIFCLVIDKVVGFNYDGDKLTITSVGNLVTTLTGQAAKEILDKLVKYFS